ncbi:murein hydrolase activator EnvC family protein [Bacillus sp. B1-b2]|uniref:murein hydrolase activator EnvC family protein n=1 Tax=Bacillus sp. B1-b2 TaxID=2653201 RepID=UPI0012623603|nr:M23 family metallopeptidase [Bacillus sp. B1-b2]KAB7666056.1 peptidoglycan DD-metalloendopeptidase family protein [Bacillus sp. B1-b2]
MKKKNNTVAKLTIVSVLSFSGVMVSMPTYSLANSSLSELSKEKSEIENKQNDVQSQITDSSNQLDDIHTQQASVETQLEKLNTSISSTQVKITEKNEQISTTKAEVEKLEKQIAEVTKRIEVRNELLKERARSYQETGGVINYLDVLMGSQSFSDFIDRVGAVATIVEADQGIIKEQEADKKLLEQSQQELKTKLSSLENMLADLEKMKVSLDNQKKEKDELMAQLNEQEDHVHAEMLSLEEEEQLLADQKVAMEKAIQLEKDRQAELAKQAAEEARKKAEAEAAAAAAKKSSNTSSSSSNSSSSNTENVVSSPSVSAGNFTKPAAAGYVSSGLGQRWGTFHAGVDIAASGTVPIYAAADGVVIRSYTSSSYGEAVFVSHYINGQTYTTVYAHMRSGSRSVQSGEVVRKGQQIGLMGNTGDSQGQHLHFELHKGAWNQAKSNAINPIGIVPF